MKSRYSLDELEELAREMTRKALEDYIVPESYRANLTLGISIEGENRSFELYISGERPSDAVVISKATLDRNTGLGTVEVFGLEKKDASR